MFKTPAILAVSLLLAACATTPSPPPGPLRIATWNMEHLSEDGAQGCKARTDADYALMRSYAERLSTMRPDPVDHVLHHGGAPIATKVNKGFDAVVKDAGLEHVTPHWLRHTCATWLMESGVDLWEAAAYTGMTPSVLLKHYGHHRPDHHAAARSAFTAKRAA